jgi:hypothetical protein
VPSFDLLQNAKTPISFYAGVVELPASIPKMTDKVTVDFQQCDGIEDRNPMLILFVFSDAGLIKLDDNSSVGRRFK